jgi:hypothetical protein
MCELLFQVYYGVGLGLLEGEGVFLRKSDDGVDYGVNVGVVDFYTLA